MVRSDARVMPATQTDLEIEQGTDWSHGWAVTVNGDQIDETWSARSQIRRYVTDTDVLWTFSAAVVGSNVVIAATAADSSSWSWRSGRYDVEITNADSTLTLRVADGAVVVSPEMTR